MRGRCTSHGGHSRHRVSDAERFTPTCREGKNEPELGHVTVNATLTVGCSRRSRRLRFMPYVMPNTCTLPPYLSKPMPLKMALLKALEKAGCGTGLVAEKLGRPRTCKVVPSTTNVPPVGGGVGAR